LSRTKPDSFDRPEQTSLGAIAGLFFKLGIIAFGGPAAHIAMMEDEIVTRRGWMSRQHFLDLLGATNLIPGPNSTEMTLHVGYEQRGWPGLIAAGTGFVLPATCIAGAFGWLYVTYGTLPEVEPFLYGIKPAVLAVILGAVWKLGRSAVKGWRLGIVGTAVTCSVVGGTGEILALLVGGVMGMVWLRYTREADHSTAARYLPILFMDTYLVPAQKAAETVASTTSLWKLGLFFLKVGSILYGSGYVLVAFLEGDLVQRFGWLTHEQLLDAVAIGQFTPGPVLSTSTFIGYILDGIPGAAVATIGIFLPAFVLVAILNPHIPKLRESVWTSAFLDAVNVSAVGLMLAVTIELGVSVLTAWPAWIIAGAAASLSLVLRVNAAWIVLGGAIAGWLARAFV
jgi:chromate transporter